MIRLAPHPTYMRDGEAMYGRGQPSGNSPYLRSVGGDELNVVVAQAMLGNTSEWISVVSRGPNGDYIVNTATDAGVIVANVMRPEKFTDVGVFWVLPTLKKVRYQRRYSAFWQEDVKFDWPKIFAKRRGTHALRLHATGITPMCGPLAKRNWEDHMHAAINLALPITMDLNHRPALGTLSTLWAIMRPFVQGLQHLILAKDSVLGLATLLLQRPPDAAAPRGASVWNELLVALQKAMGGVDGPTIVCCFKMQCHHCDQTQKRWSTAATPDGLLVTTEENAVYHTPKEPCGGGSCFAAGLIDGCHAGLTLLDAMHRGNCLAALCQETMGDMSTITRSMLTTAENIIHAKGQLVVHSLNPFRANTTANTRWITRNTSKL